MDAEAGGGVARQNDGDTGCKRAELKGTQGVKGSINVGWSAWKQVAVAFQLQRPADERLAGQGGLQHGDGVVADAWAVNLDGFERIG